MLQTGKVELGRTRRLLGDGDPEPFEVVNAGGRSRVVLLCEHAGRAVPKSLGDLGVSAAEFDLHIAYDIGAEGVSRRLSQELDAPLVLQPFSRLIVDCNRGSWARDCFPEVSDTIPIPGNVGLSEEDRRARYEEIHGAFHDAVTRLLDARADPAATILVSIHSFTPRLLGSSGERPWQIGLLFNRDDRFAGRLMTSLLALKPDLVAAFNEPYVANDLLDYAIPVHGEKRGIEHVLIEIRNNLILDEAGQAEWAGLLGRAIRNATNEQAG